MKTASVEKEFPINFAVVKGLDAYNQEKKYGNFYKRYCSEQGHRSESLNFYCKTHDKLIC